MIPIAAGVFSTTNIEWLVKMKPWYGALAMAFSSVSVCLNALRINLFDIYNINRDKKHKKIEFSKDVFDSFNSTQADSSDEFLIKIEGMMCSNCERHVKDALENIKGIKVEKISYKDKAAIIKAFRINEDEIKEVISKAGYEVVDIGHKMMEGNNMTKTLKIEGMMCKHCVMHVEEALKKVDGVKNVTVSLENKNAVVELEKDVDDSVFKEVIKKAGYEMK